MKPNIFNLKNQIVEDLSKKLHNEIDNLFIEGLKKKGFEFSDRYEIEDFVKQNCRCEDNPNTKERIYYVFNIPFFLHNYEITISNL
jgi:hypothetical protein